MAAIAAVTFNGHETKPYAISKQVITDEIPSKQYCLPYMTSIMFASIIEDCILQLNLLSGCNNELRIMKTVADMHILRRLKYQIKQVEDENALDHITKKQLESNQFKLDKLFNDRQFLGDVLKRLYVELAESGSSRELRASIKGIEDKYKFQDDLIEEEGKNRITRREVVKQLRIQRNQMKSTLYDTDTLMNKLKSKVEDTTVNTEIRNRYVENWQRARIEQHDQTIMDKEAGPSFNIDYYQSRTEQEQRVHSEVELLVNIVINETLGTVDKWMNKFDHDMEAQDLKIAIMKNKYQDATAKRIQMEETYAKHELLMKNWLQFKADRQEAINYREKMTNSAIIVQAWWRGLLVRLELGPYKPKKKPGKGGKKKEKA